MAEVEQMGRDRTGKALSGWRSCRQLDGISPPLEISLRHDGYDLLELPPLRTVRPEPRTQQGRDQPPKFGVAKPTVRTESPFNGMKLPRDCSWRKNLSSLPSTCLVGLTQRQDTADIPQSTRPWRGVGKEIEKTCPDLHCVGISHQKSG
jgi:hypothetical protein